LVVRKARRRCETVLRFIKTIAMDASVMTEPVKEIWGVGTIF
jgi:hypothetical protein